MTSFVMKWSWIRCHFIVPGTISSATSQNWEAREELLTCYVSYVWQLNYSNSKLIEHVWCQLMAFLSEPTYSEGIITFSVWLRHVATLSQGFQWSEWVEKALCSKVQLTSFLLFQSSSYPQQFSQSQLHCSPPFSIPNSSLYPLSTARPQWFWG